MTGGFYSDLRVTSSWEPVRVLLRGFELADLLPLASLYSLSSGGSDSGLEVAVRGLEGGLVSSAVVTVALKRESFPADWMFMWVFNCGS